MKRFQSILFTSLLALSLSGTALAGDITGRLAAAPGDITGAPGDITGIKGDITGIRGDITGLLSWGDITGVMIAILGRI
jgi:hypothetical protein